MFTHTVVDKDSRPPKIINMWLIDHRQHQLTYKRVLVIKFMIDDYGKNNYYYML